MSRILVAASDVVMARWMTVAVSPLASVLVHAEDGVQALERLAEGGIDLVVAHRPLRRPDAPQLLAMTRVAGLTVPFLLPVDAPTPSLRKLVARSGRAAWLGDPIGRQALCASARGLLRRERRGRRPPQSR